MAKQSAPDNNDKAVESMRQYSPAQELINNAAYIVMILLGTIILTLSYGGSAGGWVFGIAYLAYGTAGAVWIMVFAATRIVSVGSLAAAAATAVSVIIRRFAFDVPIATSLVVAAILLAVLVFYTHRTNISRLRAGTEHRFRR